MSCLSALVSLRRSVRILSAITLAIVVLGLQTEASAQSRLGYALSVCDPENLWPAGGDAPLPLWERSRLLPTAETLLLPQTQPFAVGYSLTGGYRPIYTGAVQPTGHQVTMTHGGNGYTYQPTYDYGTGNAYGAAVGPIGYDATTVTGSGGAVLVVSNPGTPYESRYGTSRGRAAVVNVAPVYGPGAYANYGADYIGNYGPGYESYGAQAAYTVETRAAPTVPVKQVPANQVPTLAPAPSPKNLETLPNPEVPKREF